MNLRHSPVGKSRCKSLPRLVSIILFSPIGASIGPQPTLAAADRNDIQDHWAKDCIHTLKQRGLISGYPDGTFRPQQSVSRAEAAVLMLNTFPTIPPQRVAVPFRDVPPTHWANQAVAKAYERGFFSGYPGPLFQPNLPIPRVQALSVLVRDGEPTTWPLAQYYDDATAIPPYAQRAIAIATRRTLVVNYPLVRQLRPNESTTRGEMATFLCRALNIDTLPPQWIAGVKVEPYSVRTLPGGLNRVPLFNSNSPELVKTEGILLSTLSPTGKQSPLAHLDYTFNDRWAIFSHHIARAETEAERLPPLYQGLLLHNPSDRPVTVQVLTAASYRANPDAPFRDLPNQVINPDGAIYAGPGSRVMDAALRRIRQDSFPALLTVPAGGDQLLMNQSLAIVQAPASNGRSTLIQLQSDGPVQVAALALRGRGNQPPSLADYQQQLQTGGLAAPRDAVPTPLEPPQQPTVFSRVAGVSLGDRWTAAITDTPESPQLTVPLVGEAIAYPIGTLHLITLGTGQIQSAALTRRYGDTAYFAHSNYGVEYALTLPLFNPTAAARRVALAIETPLKYEGNQRQLLFLDPPDPQVFFRGTVRVEYQDESGQLQRRDWHLVQRRGQRGTTLVELDLPPQGRREVRVNLVYPPDSTPPQVLTVRSLKR